MLGIFTFISWPILAFFKVKVETSDKLTLETITHSIFVSLLLSLVLLL